MDESRWAGPAYSHGTSHGRWPAHPDELREIRAVLRSWLAPLRLDAATQDALIMAVNEAASNAIEHAYASSGGGSAGNHVDISLHTEPGTLCIEIADHGTWRQPAANPGRRGLGIPLMHRLVGSVGIHPDGRGTRVLLRHPVRVTT